MSSLTVTINATDFKAKAGEYLDQSQKQIIFITKYARQKAVLLNTDYYQALRQQALKNYAKELVSASSKSKLSEEEILRLALEAEKWAKDQ